eukprot:scaffold422_cov247-Pinguiococcus_pyrenoidosus.AAC.7
MPMRFHSAFVRLLRAKDGDQVVRILFAAADEDGAGLPPLLDHPCSTTPARPPLLDHPFSTTPARPPVLDHPFLDILRVDGGCVRCLSAWSRIREGCGAMKL